jgi:hypothetical protein
MKNSYLYGINTQKSAAFTLVELAIVLVIVGLIVGGVLVGQTLITVAGMRAQAKQLAAIDTAALVFKNKYNGLPGDMTAAKVTAFGFTPLSVAYDARGNEKFDYPDYDATAAACHPDHGITISNSMKGEPQHFFIHLLDARLYGDRELSVITGGVVTIDEHLPKTPAGGGLLIGSLCSGLKPVYIIGYKDTPTADGSIGVGLGSTFTSEWAAMYDTKYDDGRPLTGSVRSVYGYSSYPRLNGQTSSDCSTATDYNVVTNTTPNCSLAITGQF